MRVRRIRELITRPGPLRWFAFRGIWIALIEIGLFVGTGVDTKWQHAVDVVLGIAVPWGPGVGVATPLAIISWLLVPAIVGAIAAILVTDYIKRSTITPAELDAKMQDLREEFKKNFGKPPPGPVQ